MAGGELMATLVLTTVGSLVAGPIGGAIGAVIGNQVDRAVLKPKGRQGPRLGELSVQTSSYGTRIPRLFGTMRVAGTVIWATDLREDAHRQGGGKGGGATTSYSYSASFAVALSARPIGEVRRIWADGKLLRGAAGDWKSETGFRLYRGSETQAIDPLIASAEGIANTPAHRGIAYAVFEDMQLADFGNRIPSLTFEMVADPGPVTLAGIAEEISDGVLAGQGGAEMTGYAVSGDSVRGALETLTVVSPVSLLDDGRVLRHDSTEVTVLDPRLLGTTGNADAAAARIRDTAGAGGLPDAYTLTYYDPARDYQAGLQRARRTGLARREERIEMPATLAEDAARSLAEQALSRAWRERQRITASLPWRAMGARAGTRVALDGRTFRVSGWTLEQMALRLELRPDAADVIAATPGDPGRATTAPDQAAGETRLMLIDLQSFDDAAATTPQIFLAAAGSREGWRRAEASLSLDAGESWQALGRTAMPAVIGHAETVLAGGDAALFDYGNSVDVVLSHDGMTLSGAGDTALVAGANLALLGDEIVQFGTAVQHGPARYRLGRLTRGRRGTEWAMAAHAAGERFVLLDRQTLLPVTVPLSAIGGSMLVTAEGPGDSGTAVTARADVMAQALRPPAPVHLTAERLPDATIRFRWTRRSRAGWAWLDGSDVPLAEDQERYLLTLATPTGALRTVEVATSVCDYTPGDQAGDAMERPASISASVVQLGTYASSAAALGNWIM
jgi:hypothetical protein